MKTRVLVVDDSLTVRMDLDEALGAAGFETFLAADLAAARAALQERVHELVVLDLLLPDGDGLEFLRELKADPKTGTVPVMLLSTEAEVRSRVQGMSAGADDYIGKPYDVGQLISRARTLVRPASARHAAPSRRRVLVIDDSATFRDRLRQAVESAGYEVHEAATGEEGLVRAATIAPHAIVIDGVLPGIDGATVVRRLKSDSAFRGTPCLLLTAAAGAQEELRSLEAGADAYVRKDEDLGMVVVRLSALLRQTTLDADTSQSLLGPKRLLAVDDSATYLHELGAQLRDEGYDVVLATSGEEALDLLRVQAVDCILLDLLMPGLSGTETCRRVKQTEKWREIPLVMLTARDDRQSMIEGINAGADDYIAKSADFDILKARLRAQLRRKHFEDENRRIREQLVRRETEARFHRLISSNIIGVIVGGLDGRLTDANDAFLALIGRTRGELERGELRWDKLTPPEWADADRLAVEQLRSTGSAVPYEKEYLRRDGSRLPILLGLVMMESADVIGFVLDRTDKKQAEERLSAYALALEKTNRELALAKENAERESSFKSKFLASMSHELRTPLNAIIGFSELLADELFGPMNEKQQEFVKNVHSSGRHLLALVNEILDLSKVSAGRMELQREWLPLALVADAASAIVQPLADQKRITLTLAVPADLPEVFIDAVRIKQVLCNLLSNAIKFTPSGGHVDLSACVSGRAAEVSCRDSGIGIREEDMPRLFREFEQLGQKAGDKREGTGLGLVLTKKLVEMHGGTIGVTSRYGEGSTFTFTLPLRTGSSE